MAEGFSGMYLYSFFKHSVQWINYHCVFCDISVKQCTKAIRKALKEMD
jgi:hypothetical protein